jgi:small-conductance mechanosensitive channel
MEYSLIELTHHPWWPYISAAAAGLAVFIVGLVLRQVILSRLKALAQKTAWEWDNIVVSAIGKPLLIWVLIGSVQMTVVLSPASPQLIDFSSRALSVLWLLSLTLAMLNVTGQVIQRYGAQLSLPLTSLTQNLARGVIFTIGVLMILNSLGIAISPILAALGVGGLAVALALQDTLSNLFAGVYVTASRQVRLGDYVKLDSGEKGYVVDIAWRSTRIRTLENFWVIIPNTKLAGAIVTNFDLPSSDIAVLVQVGVAYGSDLDKVEKVTCEVGREVMKQVAGGVPDFEPFIRYHTFGDFSIGFTVILRGQTFVDQYLVTHEFVKRLHRRYQSEGINIPFPVRSVILKNAEALK